MHFWGIWFLEFLIHLYRVAQEQKLLCQMCRRTPRIPPQNCTIFDDFSQTKLITTRLLRWLISEKTTAQLYSRNLALALSVTDWYRYIHDRVVCVAQQGRVSSRIEHFLSIRLIASVGDDLRIWCTTIAIMRRLLPGWVILLFGH